MFYVQLYFSTVISKVLQKFLLTVGCLTRALKRKYSICYTFYTFTRGLFTINFNELLLSASDLYEMLNIFVIMLNIFQHQNRGEQWQDLCPQPPALFPAQHPRVRSQTLCCLPHPFLSTGTKLCQDL